MLRCVDIHTRATQYTKHYFTKTKQPNVRKNAKHRGKDKDNIKRQDWPT